MDANVFADRLVKNSVGFKKDFTEIQHSYPFQFGRTVASMGKRSEANYSLFEVFQQPCGLLSGVMPGDVSLYFQQVVFGIDD